MLPRIFKLAARLSRIFVYAFILELALINAVLASESPRDLIAAGDYVSARQAVLRLAAGRPDAAVMVAYAEAMIRLHQNDPEGAAIIYREILRVAPEHEAARRDLTLILARTGQTESAVYHAERLIAQTTDEKLRNRLEAFVASGRSGPPKGVVFRFSISPSSNAVRGTRDETFLIGDYLFRIDDESREGSGIGVNLGATAWHRWPLSEDWSATLIGSVDTLSYIEKLPSQQQLGLRLNFSTRLSESATLSFSPIANMQFVDSSAKRSRLGLSLSAELRVDERTQVSGSFGAFRQKYPDEEFRNGSLVNMFFGGRRLITSRDILGLSIQAGVERTKRAHLDNYSTLVGGSWERHWGNGLFTNLRLAVGRDEYQGIFPGADTTRRDTLIRTGISFRHGNLTVAGFAPEIGYVYTRSMSNISLFDYRAHDLTLGLSRKF